MKKKMIKRVETKIVSDSEKKHTLPFFKEGCSDPLFADIFPFAVTLTTIPLIITSTTAKRK